MTNKVVTGNSI